MFIYSFEKLDVWQKAREHGKRIYKLTDSFPKEERFGLTSQIQRAAISVSSNIAEGTSRNSYKDKARFSGIAFSSIMEVLSPLILATDLGYISKKEVSNKLNSLRNSQLKSAQNR